jgi:hypothetical protein
VGFGRSLVFGDCGFESRRGHGCMCLVSVEYCQVEVSATGRSLVQWRLTDCGVSESDLEISAMRRPQPTRVVQPRETSLILF